MGVENVNKIILVLSGKGGVGKSSVSVQIAKGFLAKGKTVGLLDVDICGPSIPRMLGVENQSIHQSEAGLVPVMVNDDKLKVRFR
jgi:Mrp family chromosome partitioning ATPase